MSFRIGPIAAVAFYAACTSHPSTTSGTSTTGPSTSGVSTTGTVGTSTGTGGTSSSGTASSTSASGSSTSGSLSDAGIVYTPSAALQTLIAALQQLPAGQPVDLFGDGTSSATLTLNPPDGGYTFQWQVLSEDAPEVMVNNDGQGNQTVQIAPGGDGNVQEIIAWAVTLTTQTWVDTLDIDFDGVFDHQYTWVVQNAAPDVLGYTAAVNVLDTTVDGGPLDGGAQMEPDGGTIDWVTVDTETTTVTRNCEGNSGFPTSGQPFTPFISGGGSQPAQAPTIQVGPGGAGGTCDPASTSALANAVDCALTSGLQCLATSNPGEFGRLAAALAAQAAGGGAQVSPLEIGCGNGCSGVIASTQSYDAPLGIAALGPDSKMNINPSEFDPLSPQDQCSIMLHELMHWAGDPGSVDHNDPNGAGDDPVYSCGRYCAKCSHAGHGAPGNSSIDCAKCMSGPTRQAQCGEQTQVGGGACYGQQTGVCHAGLGCLEADCDVCEVVNMIACDGTTVLATNAPCCQSCPTDCNESNDFPCTGTPPMSMTTCMQTTPPNCQ